MKWFELFMGQGTVFLLDDTFSSKEHDHTLMPSYARDDDTDYPFLFADENVDELMALAAERLKRDQERQQRLKRRMIKRMKSSEYKLSRETILKALQALSDYFQGHETQGEISLFGGTVMLLAFDAREMTRDVDAIFRPTALFREAAQKISETHHLPEHWLNDGVKGFISSVGDFTSEGLPQFSHLRITRPTARYLLAMKCLAARDSGYGTDGDKKDVITLIVHLQLKTSEEVFKIIEEYYPRERIAVKTKFFVEEIIQEIFNP